MTVLHIVWSGHIGGKERAVSQLVRSQLLYSDFLPAIAFGQATGYYAGMAQQIGCAVVDLGMKSGRHLARIPEVRRALSQFQIHHFHAAEPLVMLASLMCAGARRVYTHRGGQRPPGLRKALEYHTVGHLLKRSFSALSANTRHAAQAASAATRIALDRWAVTYNGLDFDSLRPTCSKESAAAQHGIRYGHRTIIGTTAHLRQLKRIELLLQACAALPQDAYQLLVVGDGPDRQRLQSLSQTLGVQSNVLFLGMQRNIADFLQVMDVFVLPSGPRESFGNSVVEAMALGLPAIVFTDGGGLVEHVNSGATGYIVGSTSELTDRLQTLISQPGLRAELGCRAALHVRERYTLMNMAAAYDRLYESALSRRC